MLKKILALVLCLCALLPMTCAAAEGNQELLQTFVLRYGDRESKKIAITVDDCYKSATEWIKRDAELCREYGIAMTFFPLVNTGCLEEKYRDLPDPDKGLSDAANMLHLHDLKPLISKLCAATTD